MSLERLIIKPATEAQAHETVVRNASHWGARANITVEDFVKLSAIFQQSAFARDGRLNNWVLVPEDDPDTTNFYASCQILTREVLILQPGESSPTSSFGHAVSGVFVPPEHRGKGYANRLASLMHYALAPHRYPTSLRLPTVANHPGSVSVLYSALGDYYSRCIPSPGESGWTLQKSLITTWLLSNVVIPSSNSISAPIELLSESDVTRTLDSDDSCIPTGLLDLQKKDPTKTYFAFVPSAPLNSYSVTLSKLIPGAPINSPWGAKISGTNDFMTWAYFRRPALKLAITRLRASVDSFTVLLDTAVQVARDTGCESIEAWNVPEHLTEIAQAAGGETTDRTDNLTAFKWYGPQPGSKVDNADVVWALDER
ncbi:hypothetical protein RSOLAG22IIIB_09976 [Rhizoctonia solani]|uniref:LYC1 C-terminal domain-containing protein n=1 Tax=Rhizoctonia solani TaxID=456999 RepID=A0A0K6G0B9_9AGAM|nr:hypothetical protein RSOLAG22IIIB_09976 [Rhizoctonia solani]